MDLDTAHELIELDKRFYRENAHSFAATRHNAWQGWEQFTNLAERLLPADTTNGNKPLIVTDVACGTSRLLNFLEHRFPNARLSYQGIDNEPALVETNLSEQYSHTQINLVYADIINMLIDQSESIAIDSANLVCCFGFMHHVPGHTLRTNLMHELVRRAQPGGLIAISFWQFMHNPRLARRAHKAMEAARENTPFPNFDFSKLDPGDFLLGWLESRSFRYCHNFEEAEIDALVESLGNNIIECGRFSADGASGDLNRYVILQRPQ